MSKSAKARQRALKNKYMQKLRYYEEFVQIYGCDLMGRQIPKGAIIREVEKLKSLVLGRKGV